jgi:hypothetical protein
MCIGSIAPVAVAQETPFVINGYVSYANGEPVSNPTVTITNQDTTESFTAETHANSSYYRMQTDSAHVHAGDIITINATDGTYAVGAIYSITETDIENGGFRQNLPSMPDLVITSANVTCLGNKSFSITYTVANTGNENAGASQTTIYIDGSPVLEKDDPVAPLAPGEVYTNTVGPFNFPQRSPWIMVCADNDNAVAEFNEDNNCMETRLECPLPNLQVKEPGGGDPVLNWVDRAKGEYYIYYKVCNQQDGVSGGQCNTSINITTVASDGSIIHSDILKQPVLVEYGCTYKKTSTLTCLSNHNVTVEICADADTAILESNESDNCYETSFVCPASESPPDLEADLEIINHSVAWINRTDRTFNVTYAVKNIGNGSANSSTTNISVVNYDDPVPALSLGESYTSTVGPFGATFDESNFYQISINICADCYSTVTESDETNNCATDGIGIPYLNISIESVDWVELNKTYNISYEVLNSGGAASTNEARAYVYIDGNTNASATDEVGIMPKPPIDNPTGVTGLFGPFTMTGTSDTISVCVEWEDGKNCVEEVFGYTATSVFDTGTGTYPGISGTYNGTITPAQNFTVNRMYTYACAGTGGHTEYVRIWNKSENVDGQGNWSGYPGDYHNVTISPAITLLQGHTYNYTIETGSYPQIVHEPYKEVTGGKITCTEFTDTNGKRYTNWIPAIRLFYDGG